MKKVILFIAIYTSIITGCATRRDLVYFSNLAKQTSEVKLQGQEVKIQQNDLLSISINSLNQESNVLFAVNTRNANAENNYKTEGYRVSKGGMINLPVVGNVRLEGLTIEQAQATISKELDKYVKKPVVDVQLVNFKVTVIGEVNRPSTFTVQGDNINLLEALGMAGDMTVYGKRENVLVIRQQDGQRVMKRLNLNNQDVMDSPFFYLKQNDVVYVEPDKSKAIEYSPNTRIMPVVIASISAVAVLITAVLRR
ncbi:polysaccharide biosynthesis/export family protein [Pedobacter sp. ISL-68]|uniref:polysaccharide biosynthesis/export family protein n=1 Tax=unclassified Pedobacter TaxID=2628915 RepID=UPI001BECC49F|nr:MULTISPECIES: polysaccharide biosynthesis/export family protein [unclassified Pedobacter]MBT2561464.1 polysaccharide biosynthesis/export family protein [Pedobacter sp. ISL-64]MBT2590853.1 polysaccharide biosynthesis/export family protein [Pedobacter sp. ISL-68]